MDEKWDRRLLELARFIAQWSKDPSTKCGAVIADGKRVVSTGFNGLPEELEDSPNILNNRDLKLKMILHAESNAIDLSGIHLDGATLYVWPFPPCPQCASRIIQNRITRVVSPKLPDEAQERWGNDMNLIASGMFMEARVRQDYLNI